MSEGGISCAVCGVHFNSQRDYFGHCQGKKHKSNENLANLQEAAQRTVFVKGFNGYNPDCKNVLGLYFSVFGPVTKIKVNNKSGGSIANVEFQDLPSVAKCLSVRHHCLQGSPLFVKQYVFHLPKHEQMRMIHLQNEKEEEQKRQNIHSAVMKSLMSACNLTDQINQMTEMLKLTEDDEKVRALICDDMTVLFNRYFESCSVHQFGSSINRFGTKGCDLDLFLYLRSDLPYYKKPRVQLPFHKDIKTLKFDYGPLSTEQLSTMDLYDQIKLVAKILENRKKWYTDIITIPSHRCPVIKFTHHSSGIKGDLSLNNRKALYNSLLLRLYGSDPRIQKLVHVVRLWAKAHELTGGVGKFQVLTSYALTLMILFSVMKREPKVIPLVCEVDGSVKGAYREKVENWDCIVVPSDAVLPATDNKETVVDLLKGFFQFFSASVNWDTDVLMMWDSSIASRATISQDPFFTSTKAGCMMLIDPFVLTHNVLGNVNEKTRAKFIQEVKRAAEIMSPWPSSGELQPSSEIWGIAELLTVIPEPPNSPDKSKGQVNSQKKTTDQHATKIEGEQDNGDFCIPIQPSPDTMASLQLKSQTEKNQQSIALQWCDLAHTMALNILSKVFLASITSLDEPDKNVCISDVKTAGDSVTQTIESISPSIDSMTLSNNASIADVKTAGDSVTQTIESISPSIDSMTLSNDSPLSERNCQSTLGMSSCKRSSDEAKLDQLISRESLHSSDLCRENMVENPMKRFCEGICENSISAEQMLPEPSEDCSPKSENIVVTRQNQLLNSDADANCDLLSGDQPLSKNKISSYRCQCKYKLWIGRSKLKKNRLSKCSLEFETQISQLLIQQMEKLLQKAQQLQIMQNESDSSQKSPSVPGSSQQSPTNPDRGQQSASIPDSSQQSPAIPGSIQHSASIPGSSQQPHPCSSSGGKSAQKDAPPKSSSKAGSVRKTAEPKDEEVEFTCEIKYMKTDTMLPYILIKLRPTPVCLNNFKNFYYSFRSMASKLIVSQTDF
ncbi:speckle targeted PIP5K1A-regulated poly(A) polymerase [Biomphalaria glabrata]|uniref:Speckle targeted PIP5K1A-regulated poly(A) polymerase-like n=2 Tax=Biomphalaria glabrata TaxID=6526 RepID=A0A9W2YA71_BIOGL|nr:speckle targeted PIP5K1A-regulated poly(A) polymerase-like [Biomphalaria glabrata]XP_055859643.1 speckle targeted PIP5K1A-regulated poly(A) polymerase-like [Biomphalaria glabrata]KAI8744317.1 speckle targeted PIP5K1A-regulated poly(A) polymerase-like; partial [Biomphalaria glabrata]